LGHRGRDRGCNFAELAEYPVWPGPPPR
jgi:hypothetical protein